MEGGGGGKLGKGCFQICTLSGREAMSDKPTIGPLSHVRRLERERGRQKRKEWKEKRWKNMVRRGRVRDQEKEVW